MTERVPSDHPTMTTLAATLRRHGGTSRPKVVLPADDVLPVGEVVRLVLGGTEYRARVDTGSDGPELRGAYDTPRLAREPGEGTNRLAEWVADADLDFGRTVHLDVVEASERYGLRAPGERAVYEVTESPPDSLAAIAEDLDGGD